MWRPAGADLPGRGLRDVELIFLPGTYAPCPTCHGARYNAETLEITYQDATIADVLGMTVDTAATFLADVPAAARSLHTLLDVGLGYLRLGQLATELSGDPAPRGRHGRRRHRVLPGPRARRPVPTARGRMMEAMTQISRLVSRGSAPQLDGPRVPPMPRVT
jgi:hypothetical protein